MTEINNSAKNGRERLCPEGYKNSDGYIIPNEWRVVRFGSLFKRLMRKNTENNQNVLTISAQQGLISQMDYYNTLYASENKEGYSLLRKGDFAYNKSYSSDYAYGAIKRLDTYDSGIVSPLYICFTPEEGTNSEFYLQYFEAGYFNREIYKIAQEGARNHGLLNVSTEDFFNATLVLPPLVEQERIAEILKQCDRIVELKQEKINELKRLKKGSLRTMFPEKGHDKPKTRFPGFTNAWEQCKLGDYCDMFNGDRSSKYPNIKDMVSEGIPFINAGDLENGSVNLVSCNKITREKYEDLGGAKLQVGDIVYCLRGTLGKNAYIENFTEGTVASSLVVIRPKKIDGRYLFHVLNSDVEYRQRVVRNEGAAQPNLSAKSVSEYMIPIPDIDEQKKISLYFDRLNSLITLHQRELEESKVYKNTLAKLLLTGVVRVRV